MITLPGIPATIMCITFRDGATSLLHGGTIIIKASTYNMWSPPLETHPTCWYNMVPRGLGGGGVWQPFQVSSLPPCCCQPLDN